MNKALWRFCGTLAFLAGIYMLGYLFGVDSLLFVLKFLGACVLLLTGIHFWLIE